MQKGAEDPLSARNISECSDAVTRITSPVANATVYETMEEALNPFFANGEEIPMGPVTLGPTTPAKLTSEVNSVDGLRNMFIHAAFLDPEVETVKEMYALFEEKLGSQVPGIPGFVPVFNIIPLGKLIAGQKNVLGLEDVAKGGKKMMIVPFATRRVRRQ